MTNLYLMCDGPFTIICDIGNTFPWKYFKSFFIPRKSFLARKNWNNNFGNKAKWWTSENRVMFLGWNATLFSYVISFIDISKQFGVRRQVYFLTFGILRSNWVLLELTVLKFGKIFNEINTPEDIKSEN